MSGQISYRYLCVLETLEEAKYFTENIYPKYGAGVVLASTPDIYVYLIQKNIKSIRTIEIIDTQSHQRLMDKCGEIENYICGYINEHLKQLPEDYFVNTFWHFWRAIIRNILWDIEILDQCLCKYACDKVISFKYNRQQSCFPWLEYKWLYTGEVAQQCAKNKNLKLVLFDLSDKINQRKKPNLHFGIFEGLCCRTSLFFVSISAKILDRKNKLLFSSFKYNLNHVCDDLVRKNQDLKMCGFYVGKQGLVEVFRSVAIFFHVFLNRKIKASFFSYPIDFAFPALPFAVANRHFYSSTIPENYLKQALNALDALRGNITLFKGIDFCGMFRQKIELDVIPFMLEMHFQAFGLEKGLQMIKPNSLISPMNFEIYGALGPICSRLNIPSVLISHGSCVFHRDKYAARENKRTAKNMLVGDYQYLAVQSPYAKELALDMTGQPERVVSIKPTLWGRPISRTSPKKSNYLTIVHAGTFKLHYNLRYIYETSDEYLSALKELCGVVAKRPSLRLIVKCRNNWELSVETLKTSLPLSDNIIIETERPFLEVLKEADLVVSFSSTTIEEALVNKVPVLLFGGQGRYAHIPVEPFNSRNNDVRKAVSFVKDKRDLPAYFAELEKAGGSFFVPEEEFSAYCFNDKQAVRFEDWFAAMVGLNDQRSSKCLNKKG